jgi:transcriptional regulator with XRE-family HTH domain
MPLAVVRIVPKPKLPHNADYLALGRGLRQLRLSASLTQVEAGERVGIRGQGVSEIERGARGPSWHTLWALVRAYGSTLADLAAAIERRRD